MSKIELLAPAGDLERLKMAIRYGADAVYIGGKHFSLRSRASNFDMEDIAEGVAFAKEYGAHIHVTVNMIPHEDDLDGLEGYLIALERVGVHAIIVASLSIMLLAKKVAPLLEVHVSTQHSTTNSDAVAWYKECGMDRVVLARECTMKDLELISKYATLPIEAFIHGGMCVSYSGRCTLSNHMTNRDANRGGCAQSCRWKYELWKDDAIVSDDIDLFSMSSKDLNAIEYVPKLIELKVASLKIEGRMKSAYYLATVVRAYRMLIDEYYEKQSIDTKRMEFYKTELKKAENRKTSIGFYEGKLSASDHLFGVNGSGVSQEYIALVLDYNEETQMAKLQVRNHFSSGIEVEAFGPNMENKLFLMGKLYNKDNELVEVARNPMDILYTKISFPLKKYDMIRKVMTKRDFVY